MVLSHRSGRTELDPSSGWYEGELVFFDNYIIPLARNLKECEVFGASSDECLTYAMANRARWETEGEQIVADMLATDFSTKSNEHSSTRESKQGRRRKVALNSFVESDDSDCGSIVVGDPDN